MPVGFGRTGRMFACQNEDVEPDIMIVAKGLTGGYLPLAATLVSEEIFSAFLGEYHERKTFYHGHTYTGNQLCCAAALANLEIFEEEKTLEKLKGKIALLSSLLARFSSLDHVGDLRQCGFVAGIELVEDKESKKPYPWQERVGAKVCFAARKYGLLIRPLGDVIVIMPPLSISERNLEYMLDVIYQCIKEVTG